MKKSDKTKLNQKLELENYVRELEKCDNVLMLVERKLRAEAEANAALHCAEEILPSPLYIQVVDQRRNIKESLRTWRRKIPKLDAEATHQKHSRELNKDVNKDVKKREDD